MDRVPIWRLTRSGFGHRLWDLMTSVGIRVSRLRQYRTTGLESVDPPTIEPEIRFDVRRGAEVDTEALDVTLAPDDRLLRARTADAIVGSVVLSIDRRVWVDPIDANLAFDGGYLWGLFVVPSHRRRGIGSALVAQALRIVAGEADACHALVAADNRPSQRLFEGQGFSVDGTLTHVSVPGFRWTSDVEALPGVRMGGA